MAVRMFKVWHAEDKKLVLAASLDELIDKGLNKLQKARENFKCLKLPDGTDVDDDEFLPHLDISQPMYFIFSDEEVPSTSACTGESDHQKTKVPPNFVYDEESKTVNNQSESVQDSEMMEVDAFMEPTDETMTTEEGGAGAGEVDSMIKQRIERVYADHHNFEKWRENKNYCLEAAALFEQQGHADLRGIRFRSVHFFVRVKLGPDNDAFLRACKDGTISRGLTKLLVTPELEEAAGVKLRVRLDVKEPSNTNWHQVPLPAAVGSIDVLLSSLDGSSQEIITEVTASVQKTKIAQDNPLDAGLLAQSTTKPQTTTKTYGDFVSSPIGDKSVEQLAGIGPALGKKLRKQGFDKAYTVLGKYIALETNEEMFTQWLKESVGADKKQRSDCYRCLKDWCESYFYRVEQTQKCK